MTSAVSRRVRLLGVGAVLLTGVAVGLTRPSGPTSGSGAGVEAAAVGSNTTVAPAVTAAPDGAAAAPEPTTTAPPRPLTVPERLDLLVASVSARDVALTVVDAAGDVVVEHRGDAPLIPASTAKLVTAAAALAELGPDYRYRTRVNSTAPVADGVIAGDIVLIGAGDPTLSGGLHGQVMPERPRTAIEGLADQIVAAGAKVVTGRLIGDPSIFPNEPLAAAADVGGDSTTRSSGLTVNAGRRVWMDGARGVQSVVSDNPAADAVYLLGEALAQRGVAVHGGAHVVERAGATAPQPLAEMVSPPMLELLRHMVQVSDNHIADAVFRTMGAKHGDASWAGSARVVNGAGAGIGLPAAEFSVADGSGLSRNNRMTAHGLVHLDEIMAASPHAERWYSLHAVAGSSGTLRNRLVDTPASGKVGGKTGTLRDVRAFSAYVTDGSRPQFRLAILGNGLDDAGKEAVVRVQDELSVLLATCAPDPDCRRQLAG